jgi:hypothetical protein
MRSELLAFWTGAALAQTRWTEAALGQTLWTEAALEQTTEQRRLLNRLLNRGGSWTDYWTEAALERTIEQRRLLNRLLNRGGSWTEAALEQTSWTVTRLQKHVEETFVSLTVQNLRQVGGRGHCLSTSTQSVLGSRSLFKYVHSVSTFCLFEPFKGSRPYFAGCLYIFIFAITGHPLRKEAVSVFVITRQLTQQTAIWPLLPKPQFSALHKLSPLTWMDWSALSLTFHHILTSRIVRKHQELRLGTELVHRAARSCTSSPVLKFVNLQNTSDITEHGFFV